MRKTAGVVAVSVGLLGTLWTAPTAGADPRSHGRSAGARFDGGHSFRTDGRSGHGPGHSFHTHGFGHRRSFPRHFGTFGVVVAPPVVVYSWPPVFYAAPPYHSAPVVDPTAVYAPGAYGQSAPAPPVPRVVEYPTGRYELGGDGISAPYMWVWVPNPPPPPAAPPTVLPPGAPMADAAPPVRRAQIYRWVDEQGVVHLTDHAEGVPRRFREKGNALERF